MLIYLAIDTCDTSYLITFLSVVYTILIRYPHNTQPSYCYETTSYFPLCRRSINLYHPAGFGSPHATAT